MTCPICNIEIYEPDFEEEETNVTSDAGLGHIYIEKIAVPHCPHCGGELP
jgi:hypothetical protein